MNVAFLRDQGSWLKIHDIGLDDPVLLLDLIHKLADMFFQNIQFLLQGKIVSGKKFSNQFKVWRIREIVFYMRETFPEKILFRREISKSVKSLEISGND